MTPGFSVYLDLIRLAAALIVFCSHLGRARFSNGLFWFPADAGHTAVIVFFVLSGAVIAHVARTRERDPREFAASRIARIASVAFPALLLTVLIDQTLPGTSQAAFVPWYQYRHFPRYLALFAGFGSDFWFLNEEAFSNVPFWSLSYEVWYYVMFASLFYLRGPARVLCAIVTAITTGPRQWILFPLWLAGAWVTGPRTPPLSQARARVVFGLTLGALVLVLLTAADQIPDRIFWELVGPQIRSALRYSQYLPGDFIVGAIVTVNLWAARDAGLEFGWLARPIRTLAGMSFTLYLTHYPLLAFFSAHLAPPPLPLAVCVLLSVAVLAQFTERQKGPLRRLVRLILPPAPGQLAPAAGIARPTDGP